MAGGRIAATALFFLAPLSPATVMDRYPRGVDETSTTGMVIGVLN